MSAAQPTNGTDNSPVIVKPPRVERDKCGGCHQTNSDPMKICGACKYIKYCSRACQKTDWKRHRIECANNVRYEAEISQADEASTFPLYALQSHLPTFGDMDEMLRRWVKFHDFVLMAAAVHALDLMQDFSRSRTHTLWLQLSHRCFNHEEPSKYFRIANAEVVAISDVTRMGKDEEWIKTLNMFSSMSYKSEIEGKGLVAAVIVECPPLAPQIMPVGSPAEHRLKPEVLANWKEILIKCVERGEKVLHFGV